MTKYVPQSRPFAVSQLHAEASADPPPRELWISTTRTWHQRYSRGWMLYFTLV